jgi:hypothetical protein
MEEQIIGGLKGSGSQYSHIRIGQKVRGKLSHFL